jgi:PPP family 3-phenylpropionic acid transporter
LALRLSLLQAAIFAFLGLNVPFWPLWLKAQGLDAPGIALVVGAAAIVKIGAQPALGLVADTRNRRATLIWIALAAAMCFALFAGAKTLGAILAVTLVAWIFAGPLIPFADAMTLAAPVNYGRVRLWGSLSFIAGNLGGGTLIEWGGIDAILWAQVAALAVAGGAAALLPRWAGCVAASHGAAEAAVPTAPIDARKALGKLATSPLSWIFLMSAALTNASHGAYYSFGSVHWQAQGYSETLIGSLWAWGVAVEVMLFWLLGGRVSVRAAVWLLVAGGEGAVVRWTWMAFDPSLAVTVGLQALHALTYGAMHLGAMFVIRLAVRPGIATAAQGSYAAIVDGLVIGIASYAAGPLYAAYGGGAYLAMAVLGAAGLGFSLWLKARWVGQPLDSAGLAIPADAEPARPPLGEVPR